MDKDEKDKIGIVGMNHLMLRQILKNDLTEFTPFKEGEDKKRAEETQKLLDVKPEDLA